MKEMLNITKAEAEERLSHMSEMIANGEVHDMTDEEFIDFLNIRKKLLTIRHGL
jgi:hypothetical protein